MTTIHDVDMLSLKLCEKGMIPEDVYQTPIGGRARLSTNEVFHNRGHPYLEVCMTSILLTSYVFQITIITIINRSQGVCTINSSDLFLVLTLTACSFLSGSDSVKLIKLFQKHGIV